MGAPAQGVVDTTYYPVKEKMGEDLLHTWIIEVLRPLVERWLADQGRRALVGADQFMYWEQYNARKAVAPDVYVLDGLAPDTVVTAWKVWETGIVPALAVEVVSRDRRKDYQDAPRQYADLGVGELIVFDPHHEDSPRRVRWQLFVRTEGELLLVQTSNRDRIRSQYLGCWLRVVGVGAATRVRLAADPDGDTLIPTDGERAQAESERARAETERARAERSRAEDAEREVERLRAEIERLRRGQ